MSLLSRIHWPPSIFAIVVVLLIGGALLLAAIAISRKYRLGAGATAATFVLLLAALWNGAIVFAFMSPRNRHVMHLATHRASVLANAAVGIIWLSLCVFCLVKWFQRPGARPGV